MRMNNNKSENFLERIPVKSVAINWSSSDDGAVTLEVENKGVFNRLFQRILKKPRITYIHLDKNGSFIWTHINGKNNIAELGKMLEEEFGDEAYPLYERLAKYISILESYKFIDYKA